MKRQSGFTLIELMIVVAVIGVIAMVAIPAIQGYSIKTYRIAECKNPLYEIAIDLEKFRSVTGSYTTTIGANPVTDIVYDEFSREDTTTAKYKYVITAGTTGNISNSFLITCEKQAGNNDIDCGDLTLDNFGREDMVNTPTGSDRTPEACWR